MKKKNFYQVLNVIYLYILNIIEYLGKVYLHFIYFYCLKYTVFYNHHVLIYQEGKKMQISNQVISYPGTQNGLDLKPIFL